MLEQITILTITAFAGQFLYGIVQTYNPGSTLFSWHPPLMILAQVIAIQSVLMFKYIPRSWRVTIHGIIAGLATCLFCGGFYAIYQNKISFQKSHFTSWHGFFGVMTLGLMVSQSVFGTILEYGKPLLKKLELVKPIKMGHYINGLVSLLMSFVVVMLATGNWFYCITVAVPVTIFTLRVLKNRLWKNKPKKN